MDAHIHRIPELIFRQFNETITEREEKELKDWIQSSDQNKDLYNEIIYSDNLTSSLQRYFAYDVENAWKKIQREVETSKSGKRNIVSILKYAAIIIPLLAGNFFIINQLSTPESKDIFAVKDVPFQPGSKKAVLKLNNGERVVLGENPTAKEIKLDDTNTAIDKDFSLVYNEGSNIVEETVSNTLIVPKGGEYRLVLPDGTKVWLNSDSRIVFPVRFGNSVRWVDVQGEAYFEVTHNPQKPFVVRNSDYSVEVLGTSFNIMNYKNENHSATTLVDGKVKIIDNTRSKSIFLNPGEQAALDYKSAKYSVNKVEVAPYTAWKDGLFYFQSASLAEIMRKLARWYNCDFRFDDSSLENLHFTGTLDKHQNIKDLLLLISETCSVNFSINKENIIIISLK